MFKEYLSPECKVRDISVSAPVLAISHPNASVTDYDEEIFEW